MYRESEAIEEPQFHDDTQDLGEMIKIGDEVYTTQKKWSATRMFIQKRKLDFFFDDIKRQEGFITVAKNWGYRKELPRTTRQAAGGIPSCQHA